MSADVEEHVLKNYDIRRRIGKGAYGIVWKSVDRRTGEIVALKKIFDAFSNPTDAQRTYREVMFLQAFSAHENVIQLLNVVKATNNIDLYLVFEFMDSDLHVVIKNRLLQPAHHSYIMYQLFKVMKYIHSGNCVHRDLKPSNILINSQCHIKLADFGLSRSLSLLNSTHPPDDLGHPAMTDYVATRWYRAPEILLGGVIYTTGIDMWSAGCILVEMIAGKPLFPGTSTINQIEKILTVLPPPSRSDIEGVWSPYAAAILAQIPRRRVYRLSQLLPSASDEALDLASQLLQFSTERRLSAHSAVHHPYVKRFHDVCQEPVLDCDVVPHLDDTTQLTVERYRDRVYASIADKRQRYKRREREAPDGATPTSGGDKGRQQERKEGGHSGGDPDETTPTSGGDKSADVKPKMVHVSSNKTRPLSSLPPSHPPNLPQLHPSQEAPDLTITSARIVPSVRPVSDRRPGAGARGAPSRVAMGTYTQTHGTISKSNLHRLLASQKLK